MHTIIVIGGPTASGKTTLAIEVAKAIGTVILSADSRQFYQEMRIGNARPSEAELAAVPHHFIADRSIHKPLSAGRYAEEALRLLETLFPTYPTIVVAGGSGLYIQALCEGLDEFPATSEAVKKQVAALFDTKGLPGLQAALSIADPAYFAEVDQQNPRRLQRALEVSWQAGQPYSSFRQQGSRRPFATHYFQPAPVATAPKVGPHKRNAVPPEREGLYEKINQRVEQMMAEGLEAEAKSLLAYRHLPVLQTVGYQEFWPYFDGEYDLDTAIELIKRNSRRYAKRQSTWFGKDDQYQAVASVEELLNRLNK